MSHSHHLLALSALIAGACAGSAALAAPTQGETLFQQRCATCHSIAPGAAKMGPALTGIVDGDRQHPFQRAGDLHRPRRGFHTPRYEVSSLLRSKLLRTPWSIFAKMKPNFR